MQTVPVHLLEVNRADGYVNVTFARFIAHQRYPTKLPGHSLSSNPLRVRICIPPGTWVPDMREFEGKDIELIMRPVDAHPLDNGE